MIIQIIQLTDHQVTAARFRKSGQLLQPLTGFRLPLPDTAELPQLLADQLPAINEELHTVLAIPAELLSLRELQLPFADRRKIRQVLPLELAGDNPDEKDRLACDALPLTATTQLAGWADAAAVTSLISLLGTINMDPEVVTCPPLTWQYLPLPDHQPVALIDNSGLAVVDQGRLLFCRMLQTVDQAGVERTLASLELTRNIIPATRYRLDAPGCDNPPALPLPPELSALPAQSDLQPEALLSCLAMARAYLSGEIFNLRNGALTWKGRHNQLQKAFRTPLLLALLVILLLFGEAGLRWYLLQRDITAINSAVSQIYKGIFPNRSKAVDETGELKSEIRRLQGGAADISLLLFLQQLAQAKDDQIIGFNEVEYDAERFRLKGEARSHPAVSSLTQKLTAAGLSVDQPELTSRPDNSVLFTIKGRRQGGTP